MATDSSFKALFASCLPIFCWSMFPCGVTRAAAPDPELRVDLRQDEAVFVQGEPIMFAVRLVRSELDHGADLFIGRTEESWHANLQVEVKARSATGQAIVKTFVPGADPSQTGETPGDAANTRTLHAGPLTPEAQSDQVILTRQKRGATLYVEILPDDLGLGEHTIKAVLSALSARGTAPAVVKGYESEEVSFRIRKSVGAGDRVRVARAMAKHQTINGDHSGAANTLRAVLSDVASDRMVHIDMGLALERSGDKDAAIKQYQAYIRWARSLDPPSSHEGRGPHMIADEMEQRIEVLRGTTD